MSATCTSHPGQRVVGILDANETAGVYDPLLAP